MSSIRCKFLEVISEKFGQTSEFKYNLSPSNGWSGRTYNSNTRGYAASLNIRFQGWDNHLPLIELAYKNSYHSNIQMTLYEALMGESVDPQLAGSNQMTLPYLGQILYIKLWKKSK